MLLNNLPTASFLLCIVAMVVNLPHQTSAVPLGIYYFIILSSYQHILKLICINYSVGPASIRPLICINKITNQSGVCMFAMDCHRMNGTALGVCGDRFYFGSCCLVPALEEEFNDINAATGSDPTGTNFLERNNNNNNNNVVFKSQRQPQSATYLLDTVDDRVVVRGR